MGCINGKIKLYPEEHFWEIPHMHSSENWSSVQWIPAQSPPCKDGLSLEVHVSLNGEKVQEQMHFYCRTLSGLQVWCSQYCPNCYLDTQQSYIKNWPPLGCLKTSTKSCKKCIVKYK